MENQEKNLEKKDYKRIVIISLIAIIIIALLTVSYAIFTDVVTKNNKISFGNLQIENRNLQLENKLTKTMEAKITSWAPGDANIITWNTVNVGTAAAKTRQTIQVYWENSNIEDSAKELIYLYPVNMTNEEVLQDFNGEKTNLIQTDTQASIKIDDENKKGISYTFYGDTLDGTDRKGVSTEVDYDNKNFGTTVFTTVENDTILDKIGFRILLSPTASYLYQDEQLSVRIITEAMQYTEDGSGEWQVESVQDL